MSFAVRRAVAFALPILILPMAAQAAPKVGTVTSSNGAVISHDGKITPASANSPVFAGDKVMTLSGGSANVQFNDHTVKMGGSSMTDSNGSVVSMDSKPNDSGNGLDKAKGKLADAISHHHDDGDDDHGNHFGRCHTKHDGHDDGDDDDNDSHGPGHGHGHNPHCPVSP